MKHVTHILKKIVPCSALGVAFVLFGVWVRMQMPASMDCQKDTEIYSFDFLGYALTLSDYRFIGYGRFRHPLWGWLMSPVPLLGRRFLDLGEWVFWVYMLVIFAAFGVGCVLLLRRLVSRYAELTSVEAWAVTCLYLSFAHVWLLAGMPETYGLSMLLALATLNWAMGSPARREATCLTILGETQTAPRLGAKVDLAGWIALAVLTGGVTITQAAKTAIAYSLTYRRWFRRLLTTTLIFGAAAALIVLVFYLRVHIRVSANPNAPGMNEAWQTLFGNLVPLSMPFSERMRLIWVFFSEPVILRGEPFETRVITGGYDTFVQPLLLAVMYAATAVAAWRNRSTVLVRTVLAMLLVDVGIHFVAGWGLGETQLYGGHWMYAVPILVGMGFRQFEGVMRRRYLAFVFALAAAIFTCNLHGYFCHPVAQLTADSLAQAQLVR